MKQKTQIWFFDLKDNKIKEVKTLSSAYEQGKAFRLIAPEVTFDEYINDLDRIGLIRKLNDWKPMRKLSLEYKY